MTYSGDYDQGDLAPIVFDGLGTAMVVVIGFITLIVLIMVFGWAKKKWYELKR